MDPLEALEAETARRIPAAKTIHAVRKGTAYEISIRSAGTTAKASLKARFWEEFLASNGAEGCGCVDHFFAHLERLLEGHGEVVGGGPRSVGAEGMSERRLDFNEGGRDGASPQHGPPPSNGASSTPRGPASPLRP